LAEILRAEHLCRKYKSGKTELYAVKDLSLTIETGRLTVLRGRSGSGKTTLINLLSTLDTATSGKIFYQGKEITSADTKERDAFRRKEIAVIFQSIALMGEMTAYQNIDFGLRIAGVPASQRTERVRESLRLVGLEKRATHVPGELSGGEQQRIAIARAIAHQPRVLFADEPTAELDSAMAVQTVGLFRALAHERGLSVVMTTHDPEMMALADVVHTLHNGEIIDE